MRREHLQGAAISLVRTLGKAFALGMRYRLGPCELDLSRHEFTREGQLVPLEPQVFDLLALLVRHAGDLVGRDQIIEEVWQGRIVSEATISSRISALRHALGDTGAEQKMLQTIRRRGFRLSVPVAPLAPEAPTAPHTPTTPPTPTAPPAQTAPLTQTPPPTQMPPRAETEATQSIRYVTSPDGTPIAWTTTGSGPPLMRAGHFLTHLELDWKSPIWRPLLDRLGAQYAVTRYDQRSTGMSGAEPPTLALEAMCADLESVADAAGLSRFPLFAASQGVPVAIAFAARHPERVSALVLYGGYALGRNLRPGEDGTAEAMLTMVRQGWGRAQGAFATAFSALFMPDATQEQLSHMTAMQLASTSPENAVRLRRAIDAYDVTDLLAQVQAPTLVIHAEGESVQPVAEARRIAAGIPGAQIHLLDGRNHVPLPQDPAWEDLVQTMTRFLNDV